MVKVGGSKNTKIGLEFLNSAEVGGICSLHYWLKEGWTPPGLKVGFHIPTRAEQSSVPL